MDLDEPARKLARLQERPLWRVLLYYAVVFGGMGALVVFVPAARPLLNAPLPSSDFFGLGPAAGGAGASGAMAAGRVVLQSVVAFASACLLMLPVTWVYVQTRRKKGFDQSVVQTLIILPLVVAGVILLVQNSTALAFSLGGIVGAVAFRNRLRDTKDTIYIFLAIVIGVAAGVHALLVAATLSVCFNVVAVIMWWTDFGREGAMLEGRRAEQRLQRAKEIAGRTSGFISVVDRELLQSMTAEQLAVLAERARVRQHDAEAGVATEEEKKKRREWILRLQAAGTVAQARGVVEPLLAGLAKQWEFLRAAGAGVEQTLEYRVRLKKKMDRADFIARFRTAAGPLVRSADLSLPSAG
jgi:hypothetical protein